MEGEISRADFLRNLCETINELDDVISLPEPLKSYVLKNFQTLCSTIPAFYDILSPKFLSSVLTCPEMWLENEGEPLDIVIAWTFSGEGEKRIKYLPGLLETVRFDKGGIRVQKIFQLVKQYPAVVKANGIKDILLKAVWAHTCNTFDKPNRFQIVPEGTYKPRKVAFNTPSMKCAFCYEDGGKLNEENGKFVVVGSPKVALGELAAYLYAYYIKNNCWRSQKIKGPASTLTFSHHDASLFDNCIYVAGGTKEDNNIASALVYRFDLGCTTVTPVSRLKIPRKDHQLVAFHGRLYVIGGLNHENKLLATVECFDPQTSSWMDAPALLNPRMGMSCIVHNGLIWCIGGLGKSRSREGSIKIEKTIECFDPANNKWFERCTLKIGMVYPATVEVDSNLYVVGGGVLDQKGSLQSVNAVEKLVIQNHSLEWKCVGNLKIARHRCGAVSQGSHVYIIGGMSTQMKCVLNSIECFDTSSETWLMQIEPLPLPVAAPSCIYVKKSSFYHDSNHQLP